MSQNTLTVLSNNPPGGRCKLYKQYAKELSQTFNLQINTICPDKEYIHSAPSILIDTILIKPADGVIIDPDDILRTINKAGIKSNQMTGLHERLEKLIEKMLNSL
jgi:cystathionine gamma-synthase